jgi:ATP-dependent DNA helicase RecG
MTLEQLQQLVAAGESETLEFKKTTGQRSEAMHDLCAMLNQRGGRVLFGVDPLGQIVGQPVSDRTIEELAQEIQQIEPTVFPQIDRVDVKPGWQVIVVEVSTGPNRPYSYKGQAYKRVGNTSPRMSRDEYNRILIERFHGERRWETEPADRWTVADLDRTELTRTIDEAIRRGRLEEPGTRDPLELLRGLGLSRDGVLLRAAVVLFGQQPRIEAEFPQCLLRVAKFKGIDKGEFLDNRQFHGHAFELLQKAERFLRENLPIAGRIVPGLFERIDDPLYPPVALREALANALCHRDYSSGGGSVSLAIGSFGDHLHWQPALWLDAGAVISASRIAAVEPADRAGVPPPRHYRIVGPGHAEDGGTDTASRPPASRN